MLNFIFISSLFAYLIIPFIILPVVIYLPKYIKYRNSKYKDGSKNSFLKVVGDKGTYGEFLTFTYLEELDFYKRLMTNLYLPKADGSTTEIDLLMISHTGIYVIESKNYSGWIYGDENYRNWTQTLKNGKKNYFYNPIWQNKGHINALKNVLNINEDNVLKSLIVFSKRCELKNINHTTPNVRVIKRSSIIDTIKKDQIGFNKVLSVDEIERYYLKLKEFNCVDESIKEDHIRNIREGKRGL